MQDITGKPEKRVMIQLELTPENDANICKYQGNCLIEQGKRVSKRDVINKALADFFHFYFEGREQQ